MRWWYIWVISDRRFQRLCLRSILTVRTCLWRQPKRVGDNLTQGRGDAYCGMLNASYNLALRNIQAYIPEYPVGTAEECADMLDEFVPIATGYRCDCRI